MSDVLVTGGTGFVGSHLISKLLNEGHQVYSVSSKDGDIAETNTWRAFPDAHDVVHLVARSFVPDSWLSPLQYMHTNLQGTIQALEYCRIRSARMIFLSSYLYGEPASLPIPESAKLAANNPYAFSKMLAEQVCEFYQEKFGVNVVIFRPFNVYGPAQSASFLIPSIVAQARTRDRIEVLDLVPRRDYIYIEDLVNAICIAIRLRLSSGVFNIGTGVSHSVENLIETIQGILGTSLPVISTNIRRNGEIMDTVADISLVRKMLGWAPCYSLCDGLHDMLSDQ